MMPDYANGSPRIPPRPSPRSYVPKNHHQEPQELGLLEEIPLVYFQVAVLCTMTIVIAGIIIFSPNKQTISSSSRSQQPGGTMRGTLGRGDITNDGWLKPDYKPSLNYPCHIKRYADPDLLSIEFGNEPMLLSFSNKSAAWTNMSKWSYDYLWHDYGTWNVKTRLLEARPDSDPELTPLGDLLDSLSQPNVERRCVVDDSFLRISGLQKSIFLPRLDNVSAPTQSWFSIQPSGTGSYFSLYRGSWTALVHGTSRYFLYPIDQGYPGGGSEGYTMHQWLDHVYPQLSTERLPKECFLKAGDILFIPEGWFSAYVTNGETVSVRVQLQNFMSRDLIKYASASDDDSPLESYISLSTVFPDNLHLSSLLARAYSRQGHHKLALSQAQRLVQEDPFSITNGVFMAQLNKRLGRWEEAEAHYSRAQSLNPQGDFAWEMYAKALEEDGRLERAVWAWSLACRRRPKDIRFRQNLAALLRRTGSSEEYIGRVLARLDSDPDV